MTIIEWLNENVDAGDAIICVLIAYVVWLLLWKTFLGKVFRKCPVGSIGDYLSELGATGTFGICLFGLIVLLVILSLLVTSVQAIFAYGWNLLFPLVIFWGFIVAFVIFLVKTLKKK